MSLLVLCKILGLFVNTLSGDDKYSVLNRDNLTQPIKILFSQEQKSFSQFLSPFLKSTLNFQHFKKKKSWPSWPMYFGNYILAERWLDKCLKTPVSEDPFTSNMVNVSVNCCILGDSTFTIFIYHFKGNWVWKSLSSAIQNLKTVS